jgi:hypothetical protein
VKRTTVSADGETIFIHIPLTFRKRGGRKPVVTPDGAEWAPRPRVDSAMVTALAPAFRWRKMLDTGVHETLDQQQPLCPAPTTKLAAASSRRAGVARP